MKIDVLTLFPEVFDGFMKTSIMGKAIHDSIVDITLHNFRDYTLDKHQRVDDTPYGGGAGMVLQVEPIVRNIRAIKGYETATKILLTPGGIPHRQKEAVKLSKKEHIILICGHYEGFDERLVNYIDLELSIGDYVLNGGEVAAWVVIESVVRLLPGVLHNEESLTEESFERGLLEYPQYTKPPVFEGYDVPEVLRSGHHQNIEAFRHLKQLEKTKKNRPDLLEKKK